jgi:hypothetical protein
MNKILLILLVVVLSGCASKFTSLIDSHIKFNEDLSGRQLLCKHSGQMYFDGAVLLGEIYALKFISKSEVSIFTYHSEFDRYNYDKYNSLYTTYLEALNIWFGGVNNSDGINYALEIKRESLAPKIHSYTTDGAKLIKGNQIMYGECSRNDSINLDNYFDNIIDKVRKKQEIQNRI